MKIRKWHLRKCRPQDVRRLARWLQVRNLDQMSDRQLIRFLHWLFTRGEKWERSMSGYYN